MNIFILSQDPVTAAQMQCNKHVPKMVVESAQMLSTTHRILDGVEYRAPSKSGKRMVKHWKLDDPTMEKWLYKAVHVKHPCTIWSGQSILNYAWHYKHFKALCDEYTYRYGKQHKTARDLLYYLSKTPKNIPIVDQTPFPLAMKSNPECMFEDAVKAYQAFYQTKQHRFKMEWTGRPVPDWFQVA